MKRLLAFLLSLVMLLCLFSGTCGAAEVQAARQYLVKFKDPPDDAPFHIVSAPELTALLQRQALAWYEPDDEIPLEAPPRLPARSVPNSWALKMIRADSAVQLGYVGQGVRVGVIDSGIAPHGDLAENLAPGACYISDTAVSSDTADGYGHGTAVAGLIAGHNAEFRTGAASGVTLVPLKCTDGKAVKVSAICRAIYGGVDDFGCDILNLSLGVTKNYEALQEAIRYAQSRGVLIVAAVGNSGNAVVNYPAGFDGVLGTGAVEASGAVYAKSNRNDTVFLTAPGVEVLTTHASGGYTTMTGTSFAVPLVTAAAADLMSAGSSLSADTISLLLQSGAADAGADGWDNAYGYGIVDLEASLLALQAMQDKPEKPENPFSDVSDDDYWCDAVLWAYYHDPQITAGTTDTTFTPNGAATRAQVVSFLWRAVGEPEPVGTNNPFTDLKPNAFYTNAALWAVEQEITMGTSAASFSPNKTCTRGEFVTFLYRMAGSPAIGDVENPFADVADGKFYTKAILWAVAQKTTAGTSATAFSPGKQCTRGEIVTFLYRYMNQYYGFAASIEMKGQ